MKKMTPLALAILLATNTAYAFDEELAEDITVEETAIEDTYADDEVVDHFSDEIIEQTAIDVPQVQPEELVIDKVGDSEEAVEEQFEDWLASPIGSSFEAMTENDDGVNYAQMHFGIATSRSSDLTMRTVRRTFEQAFENAVEKVALESRAAVTSERISVLAEQAPNFADDICPIGKTAQEKYLQQKVTQLAEAAFIESLFSLGKSQEAIDKAVEETSVKDKQTVLEDSLKSDINIDTGWRGISSFFVQKVFMAVQEDGAVSVGVVIVKTTPAHEMIQYVTKAKGDFDPNAWALPKTFKPISQTFKTPDGEFKKFSSTSEYARYLVNQKQDETVMGAHLVYDNNGYPTVVAVSYESVNKRSSNSAEMRSYKKLAKKRSSVYAINELYRLVNLKAKVKIEVIDEVALTKKAVASYIDCSLDDISVEDMQINSTTDTRITVMSKVDKLSLKGVKTSSRSFHNPFNPDQISYYSYAIWSPLQDAKQRSIESSSGAFKKKPVTQASSTSGSSKNNTSSKPKVVTTTSPELSNADF